MDEIIEAGVDSSINAKMARVCLQLFEFFSHLPPEMLSDVEGVLFKDVNPNASRPFCYPDDKLDEILARFSKTRSFEFEAEFGIDQDQLIIATAAAVLKTTPRDFDFTPFCTTLQLDIDTYKHLGALLPLISENENNLDPKQLIRDLLCSPADCCVLLVIKYLEMIGFSPVIKWSDVNFILDAWTVEDLEAFNATIDEGAKQVMRLSRGNSAKILESVEETEQTALSTSDKINQISNEITASIKSMTKEDLAQFRQSLKRERDVENEQYSRFIDSKYIISDADINETKRLLDDARREMDIARSCAKSDMSPFCGIPDNYFNLLIPSKGDWVLARPSMQDSESMTEGKIIDIQSTQGIEDIRYKVQILESGLNESLSTKDIAMPKATLCERFIMMTDNAESSGQRQCRYRGAAAFVGLRVAAFVKPPGKDTEEWMTGTVGAMPTAIHKNEFLVFFDADFEAYVNAPCYFEHPDIFKLYQYKFGEITEERFKEQLAIQKIVPLAAQSAHDDGSGVDRFQVHTQLRFNGFRTKFLKQYFERYPNYQLARFSKPGPNRPPDITQYYQGGQKYDGYVVHIDRSLCVIRRKEGPLALGAKCFEYPCTSTVHSHNDETLFRGSTRLAQINMLGDNNLSNRRKNEVFKRMEYIENPVDIQTLQAARTQRKTTALQSEMAMRVKKQAQAARKQMNEAEFQRKKKNENIFQLHHHTVDPLPPVPPHSGPCTSACLRNLDADTYDKKFIYDATGKFFSYSPLFFPLLCGYQRKLITSSFIKVNKKSRVAKRSDHVVYIAPCGRTLRNMNEVTHFLKATHSELTIDLFCFDANVNPGAYITVEKRYQMTNDFTKGLEHIPIPVVNSVDKEKSPAEEEFIYSTRRFPYNDTVTLPSINREFCSGCSCEDDCSDASKCECQQLTKKGVRRLTSSARPAVFGYAHRSLNSQTITGIYECNENCKCSTRRCHNRVAQNPIIYPQQLFKTATCGWGIRALVDIPRGAFIANYHGALMTTDLADMLQCDTYFADLDLKDSVEKSKVEEDLANGYLDEAIGSSDGEYDTPPPSSQTKRRNYDDDGVASDFSDTSQDGLPQAKRRGRKRKGKQPNYVEMDGEESVEDEQNTTHEQLQGQKITDRRIDTEQIFLWDSYFTESKSLFVLDAKDKGNIGRWYNHCCEPNIHTQHVLVDTHDLRLPWISFFANKHIKAGEELRWNYNYIKGETAEDEEVGETVRCNCGAASCGGILRFTYTTSNDEPVMRDVFVEPQLPTKAAHGKTDDDCIQILD